MGKKITSSQHINRSVSKEEIVTNVSKETNPIKNKSTIRGYLFVCLLLTLIAFIPAFQAGFVLWDDPDYVTNNQAIRSFSNLKEILTSPLQGNYHPLTMLTFALNYAISGDDPFSYHLLNLLLHLLNVLLVFVFVYKLTKEKIWIAFLSALLFGIHPLHVESVVWISERKDVLYTCFFLLGLIYYLSYLENRKITKLFLVCLFFILSMLSKPAAIIFPIVLFAIDYYYERKDYLKIILEKTPFLILSLAMGMLTLYGQEMQGATAFSFLFPSHFRIFFGTYGIMMYFLKAIVPIQLCAFYPFPALNTDLPFAYYISLAFLVCLIIGFIWAHKKNRLIAFSILFYLINLLLVLQFKPVGSAVIADRYSYVPLIGIFIVVGLLFQKWSDSNQAKLPIAGKALIGSISLILVSLTYKQSSTWIDTASLWDNAIEVCPSSRAFTNRGLFYKKEGNTPAALEMYNKAIQINKIEQEALINRGNIYFNQGKDEMAWKDYKNALQIKRNDPLLLTNIGNLFGKQGNLDSALFYLNESLKIDSNRKETYVARSLCFEQQGNIEASISDLKKVLTFEAIPETMSDIGLNYQRLKNYPESMVWFNQALAIQPKSGLHYQRRSFSFYMMGDKAKALQDANMSKSLGVDIPAEYYSLYNK